MEKITLVTGNKNKLKEFQSILKDLQFQVEKLDLDEIQSMDLKEICKDKVERAHNKLQRSVIIEDTGFFIDELKGLPGPFIKFFEQKLGPSASLKLLENSTNRKAKQICSIAYQDSENQIIVTGECSGVVTEELKEGEGFGFDFCFIPDGYDKTFSQLGLEEKNKISARRKAIDNFKTKFDLLK